MNISGINKYMTFGLKPEWIEVLANEGASFRQTTALGNRMVPSAVTWFREAGLIGDSTAITTTLLLERWKETRFQRFAVLAVTLVPFGKYFPACEMVCLQYGF